MVKMSTMPFFTLMLDAFGCVEFLPKVIGLECNCGFADFLFFWCNVTWPYLVNGIKRVVCH